MCPAFRALLTERRPVEGKVLKARHSYTHLIKMPVHSASYYQTAIQIAGRTNTINTELCFHNQNPCFVYII